MTSKNESFISENREQAFVPKNFLKEAWNEVSSFSRKNAVNTAAKTDIRIAGTFFARLSNEVLSLDRISKSCVRSASNSDENSSLVVGLSVIAAIFPAIKGSASE